MAGEEVISNLTVLGSYILPPDVISNIEGLVFILKAAGVLAIAYLVYLISSGFLSFRKLKKLEEIEKRLDSLEKKIDKLLKKKK